MKKFLMGTSALVGVTMLAGQAVAAEAPTVSVGGYIDINIGAGTDDNNTGRQGMTQDSEVVVKASGKADNGLEYGAKIEIDTSGDANSDEAMMWVSGSWGKVELGNEDGAGGRMMGNGTTGTGTGGATDGDWGDYVNMTNGTMDAPGRTAAINGTNDDAKIQYYNSFGAVNVGVSYMDDTREQGGGGDNLSSDSSTENGLTNVIEMGANWSGDMGGAKVTLAAAYGTGDAAGEGGGDLLEDTSIWGVRGAVAMDGFTVTGTYVDRGADGESSGSTADEVSWTATVKYATGPWTVGAEYMDQDNDVDDRQLTSVGFTYSVAPGLYVGGEIVDVDQTISSTSEDAQVIILTTGVSF